MKKNKEIVHNLVPPLYKDVNFKDFTKLYSPCKLLFNTLSYLPELGLMATNF